MGVIESFNPAAEKLFEYSKNEVIGSNIKLLMPEPHKASHERYLNNYLITGIKIIIGRGRRVEAITKNKKKIIIDLSISEIDSESGKKFLGIMRDVTVEHNIMIQLKESEEMYRTVFQKAPTGLGLFENGKMIMTNAEFDRIFQAQRTNSLSEINNNISKFLPAEFLQAVSNKQFRMELSNKVEQFENQMVEYEGVASRISGEIFPIQLRGVWVIRNEQPQLIIFAHDTFKEKEILDEYEKNLETISQTLDLAPHPMMICTTNGSVKYINQKWSNLTGFKLEDISTIDEWLAKSGQSMDLKRDLLGDKSKHVELIPNLSEKQIITKYGKRIIWNFTTSTIRPNLNENLLVIIMATDVTLLIESMRQLERSNNELEQFATTLSHDFSQPIRSIHSFSEILLHNLSGTISDEDQTYLNKIINGVKRMKKLNQGLLEIARISNLREHADVFFTIFDLRELFENLLSTVFESTVIDAKATIHLSLDEWHFFGFEPHIYQLFQNLISNALKFVNEEVKPEITITSKKIPPGVLEIKIVDNGIGMKQKESKKIFKIFERLETKIPYPGTGVGLALCKKIVNQHGGSIMVDTNLGSGSTFIIQLPLVRWDLASSRNIAGMNLKGMIVENINKICFFMNDGRLMNSYSLVDSEFIEDPSNEAIRFSASLVIINNFMQEAAGEDGSFYEIKAKGQILMYEKGNYLSCCLITTASSVQLRNALKLIIFQIEYQNHPSLKRWNRKLNQINFLKYLKSLLNV